MIMNSLNLGQKNDIQKFGMGLPGDPVVKDSSFQCRGLGSIPGWGKRKHMLRSTTGKKLEWLI